MREITYTTRRVRAENRTKLTLVYLVLVSEGQPRHYGVKIWEKTSGEYTRALDLTTDAKRIYKLVDQLAKNTVTPTGLMDVLADWL